MWPNPSPVTATTAKSRPPTIPLQPQTKTDQYESCPKDGQQKAAPVPFLNSDPITHLVGHSNEAPVIMDRQKVTMLITQVPKFQA